MSRSNPVSARQSARRIDELLKNGDADYAAGSFASARQAYVAALALLGPATPVADRREIALRLARTLIAQGAPKDALHILDATAAAFAGAATAKHQDEAFEIRGQAATALGDAAGQIAAYSRLLERLSARLGPKHPATFDAAIDLGLGHLRAGEPQKAQSLLRQGLDGFAALPHRRQYQARLNTIANTLTNDGFVDDAAGY